MRAATPFDYPRPQVAAQQGAFVARMINWLGRKQQGRLGVGGLDQPPPLRAAREDTPAAALEAAQQLQPLDLKAMAAKSKLTELDLLAMTTNDSSLTAQVCVGGWWVFVCLVGWWFAMSVRSCSWESLLHPPTRPPTRPPLNTHAHPLTHPLLTPSIRTLTPSPTHCLPAQAPISVQCMRMSLSFSFDWAIAQQLPRPVPQTTLSLAHSKHSFARSLKPLSDSLTQSLARSLTQAPAGVEYMRKSFEFLSLGIMAYVGNEKALTQVRVLKHRGFG